MKPEDLTKVWDAPDHSKLSSKQFSIRLPIIANAKISAFCEMYPGRSKTAMINDLISTALEQVIESLPSKKGKLLGPNLDDLHTDPELEQYMNDDNNTVQVGGIYEDIGPKRIFYKLLKKHYKKLSKEANLKDELSFPPPVIYTNPGDST